MGLNINIWNQKGGVGKTTLALTLGTGLTALGYNVVLVDTDPQGNISLGLRGLLDSKGQPRDGLYNLLSHDEPLDKVLLTVDPAQYDFDLPSDLPVIGPSGTLRILPGYAKTSTAAVDLFLRGKSISALKKALRPLSDSAHFVLFDTPPSASLFTSAVLTMADLILIPTQLARWSLDGIGEVYRIMADAADEHHAEVLGIVPTMTELHTNEDRERLQELVERYPGLVWQEAMLSKSTVWKQAADVQKSIFKYAAGEPAARAGQRLLKHFMEGILNAYELC